MALHSSTFEYLKPTGEQFDAMSAVRVAFAELAFMLDRRIPEGPDKTFLLRQLRETAMWANVAITRQPDGSPR